MKKAITGILLVLAAALLVGCTPARNYVPDATTKPDIFVGGDGTLLNPGNDFSEAVIHSNNYAFGNGEYYYFFFNFLNEFVGSMDNDRLKELGLDTSLSTSLKNQKITGKETSWYEFFRDLTVDHMTEILLVCEKAIAEDRAAVSEADSLFKQAKSELTSQLTQAGYESVSDFFRGEVTSQDYDTACRMEMIYNVYLNKIRTQYAETLTDAAIEEYAASESFKGEKDPTVTHNIMYAVFSDEPTAAGMLEALNSGEKTADAFNAAAEAAGTSEKGSFENAGADTFNDGSLKDWVTAQERAPGDAAVLTQDELFIVLFCLSDGKTVSYLNAKAELIDNYGKEWIKSLSQSYTIVSNEEKLNGLNA